MEIVVPINYFAVVAATISSMVIGSLWYGPLFGKQWMALIGVSKEGMTDEQKRGMWKNYAFMAVGAFLMSYVLAHSLVFASAYLKAEGVGAGLMAGFWNWLGFVAPVLLGNVLWEGKPWKLWVINSGYYFITLLSAGVILALWV